MVDFDSCKSVINRMVVAYNLKTTKALCDHLNIGVSVISNRITRNTFPADLVVRCSIDTGANLKWLCTGEGTPDLNPLKKIETPLTDEELAKLERLFALKEKGAITEEEFNILKSNMIR